MTTLDLKKIRLIAIDVDGTLENSQHEVSAYTVDVIRRLQDRGILFTLATGKTLPAVQSLAQKLRLKTPLMMGNGSILQYADGRVVHCSVFRENVVRQIIELVSRFDADISVFTINAIYVNRITESVRALMDFGGPIPQEIPNWDRIGMDFLRVVKIITLNMGGAQALKPIANELHSHLDGQVAYFHSMPFMLEILPPGENKASGLRRLADFLKIKPAEIIAVGDGDNDAVMLDIAGFGAAVNNATLLCRASADVVVGSNDEDGPARFLDGLITGKKI